MYDPDLVFSDFSNFICAKKIWLAYSGGIDSHVLLYSLIQFVRKNDLNFTISAIHINHGLNTECDIWQEHAKRICDSLHVPLVIEKVIVKNSIASLEASARRSRYAVFDKYVKQDDILFTAHHQDDQAETLLLRLLRGTGVRGLCAIPKIRKLRNGEIIRPLLTVSRNEILEYAKKNNLQWLDDNSNNDLKFSRNYLRHKVVPLLKSRWPNCAKSFERIISNSIESSTLTDNLAEIDIQDCQPTNNMLNINGLNNLSLIRKKNVIRYFINSIGLKLPSSKQLNLIISEVIQARSDADPCLVIGSYSVRRFKNNIYFITSFNKTNLHEVEVKLNLDKETILPNSMGSIINNRMQGDGLDIAKDAKLVVRFRRGGEKILSPSTKEHYSLKKMFNYWDIPPWERGSVPIVYHEDRIISVIGYYIRPDYQVSAEKYGLAFILKQN